MYYQYPVLHSFIRRVVVVGGGKVVAIILIPELKLKPPLSSLSSFSSSVSCVLASSFQWPMPSRCRTCRRGVGHLQESHRGRTPPRRCLFYYVLLGSTAGCSHQNRVWWGVPTIYIPPGTTRRSAFPAHNAQSSTFD